MTMMEKNPWPLGIFRRHDGAGRLLGGIEALSLRTSLMGGFGGSLLTHADTTNCLQFNFVHNIFLFINYYFWLFYKTFFSL